MNVKLLRKIHKRMSWKYMGNHRWVILDHKTQEATEVLCDYSLRMDISEYIFGGIFGTYSYWQDRVNERYNQYLRRKLYKDVK